MNGMLDDPRVVHWRVRPSPQLGLSTSGNNNSADGRDHWPYCYTGVIGGAGIKRGNVFGNPTKPAVRRTRTPFIPPNCWPRSITRSAFT